MESILFQAGIYLFAAVLIVPVVARAGLGSVLGYLAAGIVIGPLLHLVGDEARDLQHVAEFGVALMLFVIGLELEPRVLWSMRHRLLGLGGLQVVGTTAALAGVGYWLGLGWQSALVLGLSLALSSTAIVVQTLTEKKLMTSAGGRSAFAVLLMQDVAVIPILALVPLLASQSARQAGAGASAGADGTAGAIISLVQGLPGWAVALMTVGIVAGIILGGQFLTRPIFRFLRAAKVPEMTTFFALLVVIAIAFGMMLVGFSPALGTFLAGVVLANSEFRHQMEADIAPFKGLLLGLFFITVGAGIDFGVLAAAPLAVLGLTLGIIALKGVVLFVLGTLFRLRGRDRWLFALSLAQAGEFGFVILSFAVQQRALPEGLGHMVLLAISLSMLLTPLLFLGYEAISRRLAEARPDPKADAIDEQGNVIIAGIGRFGQVVNRMARTSGVTTVVLDSDITAIALMRRFGVKAFLGDPTRPELLHSAGLAKARVLVAAVDDPAAVVKIVRYARSQRPDLHIIARARDRVHVYELFRAGADDIVREMFDSGIRAGRYVLEHTGFSEFEAAELARAYYHHDRTNLRSLAELWVPGQPMEKNEPYIARARALNQELESALMARLDLASERHHAAPPTPAPELGETGPDDVLASELGPDLSDELGQETAGDQPAATPASAKVAISE